MAKQITQEEVDKRIAAAQEIQLDFSTATTERVRKLVSDYAASIGCPKEFFLLPLQSLAAHFIGPKACVQVHTSWEEPIILWSVVMAHKGQKKSPALQCFNKALSTLEETLNADEPSDSEHPLQIFVEHFSFEELHYTMKRNNNRIVGLYDELSLLYEQLDRYKAGQADRKTILTLINGGCWRRNFRSSTSTMRYTWFNLTGFVQPGTVVALCNSKDDDGLMDRQLFSCPEEVHYDYDEYRPLPEATPSLVDLFKEIDDAHPLTKSVYTLSEDAKQEFIAIHDELNSRIREEHKFNHNHRSILSKGQGQLLRIAAAHWSIEQALVRIEEKKCGADISPWSFSIPKHIIIRAKTILDYFIAQKFAFGIQLTHYNNSEQSDDQDEYDHHRLRRIMELPSRTITPSMVSQAHIQPRINGKYPREGALKLMQDIHDLQLGILSTSDGPGRPTRTLRKRKLEEMDDTQKDFLLKKLKVDKDKYVA